MVGFSKGVPNMIDMKVGNVYAYNHAGCTCVSDGRNFAIVPKRSECQFFYNSRRSGEVPLEGRIVSAGSQHYFSKDVTEYVNRMLSGAYERERFDDPLLPASWLLAVFEGKHKYTEGADKKGKQFFALSMLAYLPLILGLMFFHAPFMLTLNIGTWLFLALGIIGSAYGFLFMRGKNYFLVSVNQHVFYIANNRLLLFDLSEIRDHINKGNSILISREHGELTIDGSQAALNELTRHLSSSKRYVRQREANAT